MLGYTSQAKACDYDPSKDTWRTTMPHDRQTWGDAGMANEVAAPPKSGAKGWIVWVLLALGAVGRRRVPALDPRQTLA